MFVGIDLSEYMHGKHDAKHCWEAPFHLVKLYSNSRVNLVENSQVQSVISNAT